MDVPRKESSSSRPPGIPSSDKGAINEQQKALKCGTGYETLALTLRSVPDELDPNDPESIKSVIDALLKVRHPDFPICTRVWARVVGFCDWPSVIWGLHLCPRNQWPELIETYSADKILVLFYGERTTMWISKHRLFPIEDNIDRRIKSMQKWGEEKSQSALTQAATNELYYSCASVTAELDRLQPYAHIQEAKEGPFNPDICSCCGEYSSQLRCAGCDKGWHSICMNPPTLKRFETNEEDRWTCPFCRCLNRFPVAVTEEEEGSEKEETQEATGLTPDWIIHAAAYEVFLLEKPSPETPYIKHLLDPCTNDKINPNIPAEKLYDKRDNGLKLENSWSGYYVILNPDYKSQVQWRFVNRAIDEVENDKVPAVVLICRNSTDTAYYQRLRPYPRVLLRRQCVKFKNYENTPIGFGIVVFCIAKRNWKDLYGRFLDAFSPYGESNMPIDMKTLDDPEFSELTKRIHEQASICHRDHWMQCVSCKKWRIVPYDIFVEFKDRDWRCKDLKSNTTCETMQRKVEVMGVTYASGADKGFIYQDDESEEEMDEQEDIPSGDGPGDSSGPNSTSIEEYDAFCSSIVCTETLAKLANLPLRSNVKAMLSLEFASDAQLQFQEPAISSLELARQASMAANRAYLKGLNEDPSAIHKGRVKALSAKSSIVIKAAKTISKKAKEAEIELQYNKILRHYEALKRKQQIELSRLERQVEKKRKEERDATGFKEIAISAVREIEECVHRLKDNSSK